MKLATTVTNALLVFLGLLSSSDCQAPSLPTFNIDKSILTVSGPSSGAAFADQMHVAFSDHIVGSGIWAGVPYLCFVTDRLKCASAPQGINVSRIIEESEMLAANGQIDALANLEDDRVFIHHGLLDTTVYPEAAVKIFEFWDHYITSADQSSILLKNDLPASHCIVSDHAGTPCGISDFELYIENCNYNSPYHMLNHLLGGELNPPNPPGTVIGQLLQFDQDEFFDGYAFDASMDNTGYVYIPPACQDGMNQCRLHVFYHGCNTNAELVGTDIITTSGFLEIADANDLVLIFPQTIGNVAAGNPEDCYNWWGYLNDRPNHQFATKTGPQMFGCFKMIQRAAGLL